MYSPDAEPCSGGFKRNGCERTPRGIAVALEGLKSGIFGALSLLKGKRKLDEAGLAEMVRSIRRALLEADFNVRQTKDITERLESRMREEEVRPREISSRTTRPF